MSNQIFSLKKEENIGIVTLNVFSDAMNTWTEAAIASFCELLNTIDQEQGLSGLILISGKPDNFCAGANLKMVAGMKEVKEVKGLLDTLQGAFNRWNDFKIPTVVAINGVCAGGGLELTLAFTARLATDARSTVIGLPECKIGLFPGGGGTQRLPRLIGYQAVEVILKGDLIPAAKALELGIIDRLVPASSNLLSEAKVFLAEIIAGTAALKRPVQDMSQIDAVADMARKSVLKTTKGRELPGPMLAIKSMQEGLKLSLSEGLEIEKECFIQTALSPEAKGSINTFFIKTMTDKPKGMMTKGYAPKPIKKIAVLGFGTMGRGLVIDIVRNMQCPVVVKDIPDALEPGKVFVRKILDGLAEKKRLNVPVDDLMSKIIVTSEYGPEFRDVNLVIEAVFEDIKVKEQVYRELNSAVQEDCVIASNTSSLQLGAISPHVVRPERFGGLHFFSPVWLMQLVEVIKRDVTSRETVDNLLSFTDAIKKRPIICRDNAGFVVNALLFSMLLETFRYLEEGNAIEKIDRAMTAFGMPVGPIRLTDEVGIDVIYKIFKGMGIEQKTINQMVDSGRWGLKKSGKGFFLKDGSVDPSVLPLIAKTEAQDLMQEQIQEGLLTAMATTGKDLLDRKIVDDVRLIDVGMIWGTGFPSDKGGPMKWADLTGLSTKLFGKTFY